MKRFAPLFALLVVCLLASQASAGPLLRLFARLRPQSASRPPLIRFTEQVEIRGRPIGYTVQTQRPFLRVQSGGCPGGSCPR